MSEKPNNHALQKGFEESIEKLKRELEQSAEEIKMFWTKELMYKTREHSEAIARGQIERQKQMTDTNKLTGREAVIALMDGKKICRYGSFNNVQFHNTVSLDSEERQIICIFNRDKSDIQTWQLSHVLQFNDWELVPEPRVWEGILEGRLGGMVYEGDSPYMPDWILGKKIKVRAEEIL